MASASLILSTSLSTVTTLTTLFNTVYQTSKPVVVSTMTAATTYLTTLQQPEIVVASTQAFPTTFTKTFSSVITSYVPPAPVPGLETTTSTVSLTAVVTQPAQTITYTPSPITTISLAPPTTTPSIYASTVTVTEIIFLFKNSAGAVYTTLTTIIPYQSYPTSPIVIVPGGDWDDGSGWSSWNDAQKGGLLAGAILIFLLLVGLLLWCLLRRRQVWLASEWATGPTSVGVVRPSNVVVPYQQHGGWGYTTYG